MASNVVIIKIFFNNHRDGNVSKAIHCEVEKLFKLGDSSYMVMRVDIKDQRICDIFLIAKGFGSFTEEHVKLFGLLESPFGIVVSNAQKHWSLIEEYGKLKENKLALEQELESKCCNEIIGHSDKIREALIKSLHVAATDSPVLILGETGTGKDLFASYIQKHSPRCEKPFLTVNCGAIFESLIDSDLFGHEKGAFTGALSMHKGRFERADTGTIFLDEVGELTPAAQVKLLRILQNGDFERVGGKNTVKVDVRVIAATNRDLKKMMQKGSFREDLYYRLSVFPIILPPLKERINDIPFLVDNLIKKISKRLKMTAPRLASGEINKLKAYSWPGNIRELSNVIEQSLISHIKGDLVISDLAFDNEYENNNAHSGICTLKQATVSCIENALAVTNGKISGPNGAAAILDVKPTTLRSKIGKLNIR